MKVFVKSALVVGIILALVILSAQQTDRVYEQNGMSQYSVAPKSHFGSASDTSYDSYDECSSAVFHDDEDFIIDKMNQLNIVIIDFNRSSCRQYEVFGWNGYESTYHKLDYRGVRR